MKQYQPNNQELALAPLWHNMIYIEGGSFEMGSNEGHDNEEPVHKVTLDSFAIAQYPVTQVLYEKIKGKNPSKFNGKRKPVETVSWYDAVEFCNALSKETGLEAYYHIDKSQKDSGNINKVVSLK